MLSVPSMTLYCTTIYVTTLLGNNEALTGPAKLVAPLELMLVNFTLVPKDGITVQCKELWFTEQPKLHDQEDWVMSNVSWTHMFLWVWSSMVTSYSRAPEGQERATMTHCGMSGIPHSWLPARAKWKADSRPHVKKATERCKGMNMKNNHGEWLAQRQ